MLQSLVLDYLLILYTVNHKKVELFCFCNNFVKYKRNWIIFGMFLA